MGLFSFLFGSSPKSPTPDTKNPAEAGRTLRQMILNASWQESGIKPSNEFPRIHGVLMDWPISSQIATVFTSSTGAASLYTTSTFGIIGGEAHETVRSAAKDLVRAADRYFDASTPTNEYPYPAADRVRFYFLTFDGVRLIDTDFASIASGTSKYAELFGLGQFVLTQLRLINETRQ